MEGGIERNECSCLNGYIGEFCERRIRCLNGEIIDNRCICMDGYSGSDCGLRRPLPETDRIRNRGIIVENSKRNCLNGREVEGECICNRGFIGERCGERQCINGDYEMISNECICYVGFSGERCEVDCRRSCSNKGDICNKDLVCKCEGGWYGDRCEKMEVRPMEINYVNISDYAIGIVSYSNDRVDVSVEECMDEMCIPLSLEIMRQERNITGRRLSVEYVEIEIDRKLMLENSSIVVSNRINCEEGRDYVVEENIVYVLNCPTKLYFSSVPVSYLVNTNDNIVDEPEVIFVVPSIEPTPEVSEEPKSSVEPSNEVEELSMTEKAKEKIEDILGIEGIAGISVGGGICIFGIGVLIGLKMRKRREEKQPIIRDVVYPEGVKVYENKLVRRESRNHVEFTPVSVRK
jgi:hypothetical protein